MTREFQIRIENVNDDHDVIDVLCYTSLAEANIAYQAMVTGDTEGAPYHIELLEVLQQNTICNGDKPEEDDFAYLFAMKGGVS